MTTISISSVRGAPGVTTTSLLLASALEGGVLVEADLNGGVVAVRYQLGREPGLTTLAAANPRDSDGWREHAQDAGGVPVIVGPDAPEATESLWRTAGERLAGIVDRIEPWVVIDAGRIHRPTALVSAADLVVVLVRPVGEHLVGLTHAIRSSRLQASGKGAIAVVGEGPYRVNEIQEAFDCPVIAHLPHDPGAADQLFEGRGGRSLNRSRLARAVASLSDDLHAILGEGDMAVTR